jgi:hypothetical protein
MQVNDLLNSERLDYDKVLETGYYTVENNFGDSANFPIIIKNINDILDEESFEVCINETTYIYSYDCSE